MSRSSKKTTKKTTRKTTKKTAKKVAKKTAKKAVSKTVPRRNTKRPASTARALVCADGDHCFWVHNGPILQDLQELAAALSEMPKAVFTHHAAGSHNDFAEWVEHVLDDAACAADLRTARTPRTAHTVVIRHLRYYA